MRVRSGWMFNTIDGNVGVSLSSYMELRAALSLTTGETVDVSILGPY